MEIKALIESDEQLQNAVICQMNWDRLLSSARVGVAAINGVVTLIGNVQTYATKYAAGKAAQSVKGVESVVNLIEVTPLRNHSDAEIVSKVTNAMKLNVIVPDRKITVVANEGFVTLEGTVGWEYQSQGAERCARHAAGVRGVTNQITVKPRVSAAELSRRIEEALHGKPEADSRRILVAAVDGKVYLYGSVHSSIEREKATQVARSGPGVAEVVDFLSVVP